MNKHDIEILPVDQLLARQFPPHDSIVGNVIDKGGAVLISGPPKVGKSLFATQLALSIADRTTFLRFPIGSAEYRVLALQAEVSPKRMKERFEKQVTGFSADAQSRVLNGCVFSQIKLDNGGDESTILGWVALYRPDILIVDPLTNFHCGDENVAKDMSRITNVLDRIRAEGVAVILVHHHGKNNSGSNVGNKARGSSVLPGWYDSHFSLEWAEPQKTVRLKFELRHDETPEDIVLKLNKDTLLFERQDDEKSQISLVVSVVREGGPADADTVAQQCHRSRQWASDWLNRAVAEDKLVRTGTKRVLYSMPGQSPETFVGITPDGVVVSTNTEIPLWVNGKEISSRE